jgi:RHS repeat-associated protein
LLAGIRGVSQQNGFFSIFLSLPELRRRFTTCTQFPSQITVTVPSADIPPIRPDRRSLEARSVGRFQYTGQIWLSELGLYHYKARLYSPYLGRFLQTDPVGYEGGINLYAYVMDDPVNGADPSGNGMWVKDDGPTGMEVTTMLGVSASRLPQGSQQPNSSNGSQVSQSRSGAQARNPSVDHSILSDTQVTNIVFNETRSLSGDPTELQQARQNIAHVVINGDRELGARRPITASTAATVPKVEQGAYADSRRAVSMARGAQRLGIDPTGGATNFNLRGNSSMGPWRGLPLTSQAGPFNNSFPTTGPQGLPATGVYVNTYGEVKQ